MQSNETTTSPPPHVGSTAELGLPARLGDSVACHWGNPKRLLVMNLVTPESVEYFNQRNTAQKTNGWWVARRPNTGNEGR